MNSVAGVILCGGKASRMNGANKGLVEFQGQYLFQYALENLKAITARVVVNTNTEADKYHSLGLEVIGDGDFLYQGPLAGIYAGLTQMDAEWIAFAPCDQLALPARVYQTLLERAKLAKAAFAVTREDMHPTCCVVSQELAGKVREALEHGELRLGKWMQRYGAAVDFSGIEFANVNELPR